MHDALNRLRHGNTLPKPLNLQLQAEPIGLTTIAIGQAAASRNSPINLRLRVSSAFEPDPLGVGVGGVAT
jgi:hypothetical protein